LLVTAALLTGAADDVPLAPSGQPAWLLPSALQAQGLLQRVAPSTITPEQEGIPDLTKLTKVNEAGTYNSIINSLLSPTLLTSNPFFQNLGSNGRTCVSCHEPDQGWSISPPTLQKLFKSTPGAPVFRTVDGAGCGDADVSTPTIAAQSFKLLLSKGLLRVFIPLPDDSIREFSVTNVTENIACNNKTATGLTSPTAGVLSFYRRPLPTTNLSFLTSFMWDGREPSLLSQAGDATMIHAQGATPLTPEQKQAIVDFESSIFTAQITSKDAGSLTEEGAQGGPDALSRTAFHVGINDPNGTDPTGVAFNPTVMSLYFNWNLDADAQKASVARGETIFNERQFLVANPGVPSVTATCSRCHNTPNVGNHSTANTFIDIGVTSPGIVALDTTDLPVFSVRCEKGPSAGITQRVTDLGRAMITGKCADVGKFKVPILRALEARSPYFHNGTASDLDALINFYNSRFSIHLTDQDKLDLKAFLESL